MMINPSTAEPERWGPMSRGQALARGLTPSQLRNKGVDHPHRDCYVWGERATMLADRCAVALAVLPQGAAFSHFTAAALWELPLPRTDQPRLDSPLHITVPSGSVVPSIRGVRGHGQLLPQAHLAATDGLPVTGVARTMLDLASGLVLDALVVVADAALSRRLCERADLDQVIAWATRRRGIRRLSEALDLAHAGSRSPKETELRLVLVRAGLPMPEPNADVTDADGGWIANVDLLYRRHRIALEYDGRDHGGEDRRLTDLRRRNLLERAGYYLLAYSAPDLRRPWSIESDVRHAFAVQSARLGLPDPSRHPPR